MKLETLGAEKACSVEDQRSRPFQNQEHNHSFIICSLAHYQQFLKLLLIFNYNFSSYFEKNIKDRQKDKCRLSHNLLRGSNYTKDKCSYII